jgi:hypothetical protein
MAEIIVSGEIKFAQALQADKLKMSLAAQRFVTEGADIIADSAKEQWRSRPAGSRTVSKTGRVYYRGNGPYKAERPNPTIRTGNTRNSIRRRYVKDLGEGKWESGTGPSTEYAPFVEFGSRYIQSPAFPFMKMGVENAEGRLRTLADRLFAQAL